MCGIAGIVAFDDKYAPDRAVLEAMHAAIAHRGPDGAGVLSVPLPGGGLAGLVHRRLAVLDPDPRSNQPFSAEHQGRRVHLTYNGEIYNYRELRSRLERELPGFEWRTSGDTEVLIAAYLAWGERCVDELVGMFAFAVLYESAGMLLLARDRMGQKPLYVATAPGGAAVGFASELSALARVPWVDTSLSPAALSQYLAFGYVPTPWSIYTGAGKHPPSTITTYAPGGPPTVRHYYDRSARCTFPAGDPATHVRAAVEAAVASQLVSDVPLGCFLSGGVDSSVVALCAQRAIRNEGPGEAGRGQATSGATKVGGLLTFTARFDDPRYDESPFAEAVARHLGTEHHTFTVTPDAAADLPGLARVFAEPFADSSLLPTFYLSRAVRGHVKVALSGDGGDELFAGYDRYRALSLTQRFGPLARLGARLLPADRLAAGHPKSRLTRLGRLFSAAHLPPAHRYESYLRLFPPGLLGAPELSGSVGGVGFPPGDDLVWGACQLDRLTYLEGDLLTKLDRASMAVALEARNPFMDHRLVSLAASYPGSVHLASGPKSLLRKAFGDDLPTEVFTRPKRGFAVPVGDWFRTTLRPLLADTLTATDSLSRMLFPSADLDRLLTEHHTAAHDHTHRLFALLMLDLWHRTR